MPVDWSSDRPWFHPFNCISRGFKIVKLIRDVSSNLWHCNFTRTNSVQTVCDTLWLTICPTTVHIIPLCTEKSWPCCSCVFYTLCPFLPSRFGYPNIWSNYESRVSYLPLIFTEFSDYETTLLCKSDDSIEIQGEVRLQTFERYCLAVYLQSSVAFEPIKRALWRTSCICRKARSERWLRTSWRYSVDIHGGSWIYYDSVIDIVTLSVCCIHFAKEETVWKIETSRWNLLGWGVKFAESKGSSFPSWLKLP